MNPVRTMPKPKNNESPGYTAVFGSGMLRNNMLLPVLLGQPVKRWYPWHRFSKRAAAKQPQHFAGWGNKKSYRRAWRLAQKIQRPVLSIEDGFLRSLDSGINSRYGCSVVVDDRGVYFDVNRTSALEQHCLHRLTEWSTLEADRANQAIQKIIDYKLSKYNAVLTAPILDDLVLAQNANNATASNANANNATTNNNASASRSLHHVLLIDQVAGDASVKGAGANRRQFERMLKTACANHPQAQIWIKAHPASQSGYLNQSKVIKRLRQQDRHRVRVLKQAANPIALLHQVAAVYTVSSHMGFEALLLGKKVYCFGVAWYAGWGLTEDSYAPKKLLQQVQRRRFEQASSNKAGNAYPNPAKLSKQRLSKHRLSRHRLSLAALFKPQAPKVVNSEVARLFYAAYIDYSRYADPASRQACAMEDVIEWLHTNRYWLLKLPKKITVYEFSRWKQGFVADFLQILDSAAEFSLIVKPKPKAWFLSHSQRLGAPLTHAILVWGLGGRLKVAARLDKTATLASNAQAAAQPPTQATGFVNQPSVWCMEDGFIRSNGLGSTLLAPLSVVIDGLGIYYDASAPSDLEQMLLRCPPLTVAQAQRVKALQHSLLTQRVSKYHVGQATTLTIPMGVRRQQQAGLTSIILIVGQVEDDLSVKYCGSSIQTNTALIERVRQDNPSAYLVYKPHPDVEAGLRVGQVNTATLKLVDAVAQDIAIADCLTAVDAVHTISSLTGFEALVRGKSVCCYGMPFYAGWGLTQDMDSQNLPWRQRRAPSRAQYFLASTSHVLVSDGVGNNSTGSTTSRANTVAAANAVSAFALTLPQLLYCVLIQYPMYRLPQGYGLAQVEQVIDRLYGANGKVAGATNTSHANATTDPAKTTRVSQSSSNPSSNKQSSSTQSSASHSHKLGIANPAPHTHIKSTALKQRLKTRFMQLRHQLLILIR